MEIEEAGLTKSEAMIYRALIDLGPSLAGQVARRTGLHRRSVYDSFERLIKKGLVGYIVKNNRKYFEPANPRRLLEIIEEKRDRINAVLPLLEEQFISKKEKQETVFYKGKNGLKSIFEDQLAEKKEILIIGSSKEYGEVLPFYFKGYDEKRKKERINARIIFSSKSLPKKIPLSEIRLLPQKYSNPLSINIYADKVVIILWSRENPIAILIKNKEISEGYRKYFELLWNISKR
ncbi:MAG: helix-turn-helix domain-containing protein [archaeon]